MDWGIIMNKLIYWFISTYWKIMTKLVPEQWQIFKEDSKECELSEPIDESQIFTIVFAGGEIIVIYQNSTNQRFLATPPNLNIAHKILARLTQKLKFDSKY